MPIIGANGLNIAYETHGSCEGPPVLMIMGFNMTLSAWPPPLIRRLADAGLHLILMDNRDAGLSDRIESGPIRSIGRLITQRLMGQTPQVPYTLDDMANDCLGLLDALEIERAHIIGISMGGMIAQCLALRAPSRLRSMALMMTHGGAIRHGVPSPRLLRLLRIQPGNDPQAIVDYMLEFWRTVAGPDYPPDEVLVRNLMKRSWERSPRLNGRRRQAAAITAAPDRTRRLRELHVPTLVIHGDCDPLVRPAGGRELSRVIPGARLELIRGMGHDLPAPLHERLTGLLGDHVRQNHEPGS